MQFFYRAVIITTCIFVCTFSKKITLKFDSSARKEMTLYYGSTPESLSSSIVIPQACISSACICQCFGLPDVDDKQKDIYFSLTKSDKSPIHVDIPLSQNVLSFKTRTLILNQRLHLISITNNIIVGDDDTAGSFTIVSDDDTAGSFTIDGFTIDGYTAPLDTPYAFTASTLTTSGAFDHTDSHDEGGTTIGEEDEKSPDEEEDYEVAKTMKEPEHIVTKVTKLLRAATFFKTGYGSNKP